jgi:hypothetical protein
LTAKQSPVRAYQRAWHLSNAGFKQAVQSRQDGIEGLQYFEPRNGPVVLSGLEVEEVGKSRVADVKRGTAISGPSEWGTGQPKKSTLRHRPVAFFCLPQQTSLPYLLEASN